MIHDKTEQNNFLDLKCGKTTHCLTQCMLQCASSQHSKAVVFQKSLLMSRTRQSSVPTYVAAMYTFQWWSGYMLICMWWTEHGSTEPSTNYIRTKSSFLSRSVNISECAKLSSCMVKQKLSGHKHYVLAHNYDAIVLSDFNDCKRFQVQ